MQSDTSPTDDGTEREMECPNCGTVRGDEIRRTTGEFADGTHVETFSCKLCSDATDERENGHRVVQRETVIGERYIRVDGTPMVGIDPDDEG